MIEYYRLFRLCTFALLILIPVAGGATSAPVKGESHAEKIRALLQELKGPDETGHTFSGTSSDLSLPDDPASPSQVVPGKRRKRVDRKAAGDLSAKSMQAVAEEPALAPLPRGPFAPDEDGQVAFDRERARNELLCPTPAYRIGPGDELELNVFAAPEFTNSYIVAPDGSIMIPIYGRIEVAGHTPEVVAANVRRKLLEIYVDPKVVVDVKQYFNNYVLVLGRVTFPGRYEFKGTPTLLELFAQAKGVKPVNETASGFTGAYSAGSGGKFGKCTIFRGGDQIIEVDLDRLLNNGVTDLNLPLLSGDIVNVPKGGDKIYVLGQVVHPGLFNHERGMTMLQALSLAGNSRDRADLKRVRIVRKKEERRQVITCNIADLVRGKRGDDPELLPDDIVYVPGTGVEKFLYTTGWINSALSTVLLGDTFVRTVQRWD